jgi:predicted metal-dependent phosphoesterase TrpH
MEIDLHIHSYHSNDSRSAPSKIVEHAIKVGLGAIAVTDHNSWGGAREAAKTSSGRILVIPGAEIKTDKGDVLAIFVEEEISSRAYREVLDEIKSRGGVSIIPHPGDSPKITRELVALADGLEVFNSTCLRRSNAYSSKLGAELKKPGFASSDAHMVMEVGNGRTRVADCSSLEELRKAILKDPVPSRMERSNLLAHRINEAFNFAIKGVWRR